MAFTGPDRDRQMIRELLETYSDAVIRQDVAAYLACWADDGRRTGAGGECQGKEELRTHWDGIFQTVEQMAFINQVASIAVDNDRAQARSYCLEIFNLKDGTNNRLVGEYTGHLVRVDGDWLFSQRHYRVAMRF